MLKKLLDRPKSQTLCPKGGWKDKKRTNPVPFEAMDLVPHRIDPKSIQNIIKNSCFEGVFGSLPKTENPYRGRWLVAAESLNFLLEKHAATLKV